MKYLYLVLLLLPLKVLGQVKLQDVTINGKQPKFVRLKGYYTNDFDLKSKIGSGAEVRG